MKLFRKGADEWLRVLETQPITLNEPGTVLRDFNVLLDFIKAAPQGIPSKSDQGNLPSDCLPSINAALACPVELDLKRALLRDYPNIAGLYMLMRILNIAVIDKRRIVIDAKQLDAWRQMNPVEQYFCLLETWLLFHDASILGAAERTRIDSFRHYMLFLTLQVGRRRKTFPEYIHTPGMMEHVSAMDACLMAQFGLIEVVPAGLKGRRGTGSRGWLMSKASRTPWGEAVAQAICGSMAIKTFRDLLDSRLPDKLRFGFFKPTFQKFYPDWKRTFELSAIPEQPGLYVITATLDHWRCERPVWRQLAVRGTCSLDELANAVLEVFGFDSEHLYTMTYRDARGSQREFVHPFCEDGHSAGEITLAESGWPVKSDMRYLYDFGDKWEFDLRLDRIDPPTEQQSWNVILVKHGEPPKQYPMVE